MEVVEKKLNAVECEREIYQVYQDVIAPLVINLEILDNEYPIEIFNEIRSIFAHLARYHVQDSEQDVLVAKRHLKRAILDCYKYLCVSLDESVKAFNHDYRDVDLSRVDNGKFLDELNKKKVNARKKLREAKNLEIKKQHESNEKSDSEELFSCYEDAYNEYCELDQFIIDSNEAIGFAANFSKKESRKSTFGIVVGIVGIIVGIVIAIFF